MGIIVIICICTLRAALLSDNSNRESNLMSES